MKRSFAAVLIAFLMTATVGLSIFAIGVAALHNRNGVAISNAPAADAPPSGSLAGLKSLVSQYQEREQQYRQREQQLEAQLARANAQIQEDQQTIQQVQVLLVALRQRGLISVTRDGRVLIGQ